VTGRWHGPRFVFIVFLRRQPNAENPTSTFGLLNEVFDLRASDLADACQKRPLVGPWYETLIKKDAVAAIARPFLQGQGDEMSESSLRQRVLIGKQPVVGIEADVGTFLHGFGQQVRTEPPRERS